MVNTSRPRKRPPFALNVPTPPMEVVEIEPTNTQNSNLLALLTIRFFHGLDVERCRLIQLPDNRLDIIAPQLAFYNPQTESRMYSHQARWVSTWREQILSLAVRAWEEVNAEEAPRNGVR